MKVAVCLVLCAISISAAETISQVRVLGAPSSIEMESRAGEPLDPAKLRHDVKTLWQSGRAADVTVETVPDGDAVQLVFRVRARTTLELRKVQVEPVTPGVNLGVSTGAEIDSQGAQQVAANVRKQLEGSGYPNAVVGSRLLPVGAGKADLKIEVDKGQQVDIAAVTFSGNLGVRASDLRRVLRATKTKTMVPRIPGIWKGWRLRPGYNQDAVRSDVANLQSFYYRRGYFDAQVRADSVRIDQGKAWIGYAIDSGPRSDFSTGAACREFFRERRDAERRGVLDFSARLEQRNGEVTTSAESGPAYRVNRIEFRGNHSFSGGILRRSFLLSEGDVLDQMLLRKSLARLNGAGMFEQLTAANVVVNTPPGSDRADLTVWVKEKKMRSWFLSGPVGPMSVAGPLEFAIGSRLPAWGQGILELSTYTLTARLMLFAKPVSNILPFLPHKRFLPLLTIQRPILPGQPFLSGAAISPQLGWRGMLLGYGASQGRGLLGGLSQTERAFTPPLPVTIVVDGKERGVMNCEVEKTKLDWARQIGGIAANLMFSLVPF
jgi:outer membrane protein insertion porin family